MSQEIVVLRKDVYDELVKTLEEFRVQIRELRKEVKRLKRVRG